MEIIILMKKCDFSEKVYEIFFIHEFLNLIKGSDVYCPSQVREANLGYDALFNTHNKRKLLLFQFKVCTEYKKKPKYLAGIRKCFKFYLHSNNNYKQHNKLVMYNNSIREKYLAYYVVPYFNTNNELYDFQHNNVLILNSLFLIPTIKIYDNKSHYINFNNSRAYQHSVEDKIVNIKNFSQFMDQIGNINTITKEEFAEIINQNENMNIIYVLI